MKYGRELKKKLGKNLEEGFSSTDEEDPEIEQKAKLTMEEIMKMAAEEAKREAEDEASKKIENVNDNPWLKESVAKLRAKKAALRDKMQITEEHFEALREQGEWNGPDFDVPDDSFNASLNELIKEKPKEDTVKDGKELDDEEMDEPVQKKKTLKKKKKLISKKKTKKADDCEEGNDSFNEIKIKNLFGEIEDLILNKALKPKKPKKAATEDSGPEKKRKKMAAENQIMEVEPKAQNIDLHKYLQTTTAANTVIPEAMEAYLEEAENQDVSHDNLLAEAFADDDVVDEFEEKKRRIEGEENPIEEETDITLMGWGSWTGPGTEEMTEKKKQRMTRKPKDKPKRKDGRLAHVIIRENLENPIEKLQPTEIPFPFTRAEDYEALIRQPIGRDWNPITHTAVLTRPEVVAPAGRIIRPMEKSILAQRKANEVSSDEEDN
jgi:U3 small nucleolar RNA-associated protein 14